MQFVPYRALQNEPSALRKKLESEGDLIVTVGGKPFAIMINLNENEDVQDIFMMVSRMRAQMAVRSVRREARKSGVDTNVLVSGMLSKKGPPGKILDLILNNQIQVAYDDWILGEYEEVLVRPELRLDPNKAMATVDHIELAGKLTEPKNLSTKGYTDPDDIMFAEVFITSNANALVTGNLRHYKPLLEQNASVLSPSQFLQAYFPLRGK